MEFTDYVAKVAARGEIYKVMAQWGALANLMSLFLKKKDSFRVTKVIIWHPNARVTVVFLSLFFLVFVSKKSLYTKYIISLETIFKAEMKTWTGIDYN